MEGPGPSSAPQPAEAPAAAAAAAVGGGGSSSSGSSGSGSAGSSSAAAPAPPPGAASKLEYLEQKYGGAASHVALSHAEVGAMVDKALADSPTVTYLLSALKQGGCGVGRPFFHVTRCADDVGGGFSTDYGVILCANRLNSYAEVELALAHELIHAYDFCRASNMDLTNCNHHACTEIRAANLSGDCSLRQEFLRGNLSEAFVGQHRRCVRRRALLSVGLNPFCQGGRAEAAVAEMMPRCLKDTDPFPRVPGL
ncbi:ATP23 [Scenedesmus sp. PABB004]|nr:ATP23 [Scenedesmus sp. PABB004]